MTAANTPQRNLGPLTVSAVGLGCMGMSEFYGPTDEAESIRVMHRSIELGMEFFDTADVYGVGRNEELVGKAIRDRRDKVTLATKFANVRGPKGEFLGISGKPDYVRSACEASLKRLKVDVIDLYYQHRVDPNTPIEDTVGAMAELVKQGKVRHLGMSEAAPATLRRAVKVHPIAAVQSEYSLWTRDPERNGVLETCARLGVGFVPYSPLGRGFLTGAITDAKTLSSDDFRLSTPRFQGDNFARNLELAAQVKAMAADKGCTPAQLALAWVLAQGEHIVPIPGTKRRKYLDDNLGAVEVTLSADELARLDAVFAPGAAAGERYTEAGMAMIGR